jgi:preprotein translocase subunit SecG
VARRGGDGAAHHAARTEIEVGSVSVLSQYRSYLQIIQIIVAIALTIAILMQARGAGLGSVFGGSGAVFKTRRGIDKLLFNTTIGLAIFFGLLSLFVAAIPSAS